MSNLSIGKAWDEAKTALIASRRLIVPVALGMVLLPAVIASMVEPSVPKGQEPEPGLWMLVVLAMVIVMMVAQLAIVLLVNGWRGSVGEAIGQAGRRTLTLILAALAIAVPMFLLLSLVLAIGALAMGGSGEFNPSSLSPTGRIAIIALIFALLFVSVRLMPLIAVVASEPIGPLASLKRSFVLTAGNFWRLLGFVMLVAIAFFVVAVTVGAVVGSAVTLLLGPPEPWSTSHVLIALTGGLVQAGFVMVYTGMLARIYEQLRA